MGVTQDQVDRCEIRKLLWLVERMDALATERQASGWRPELLWSFESYARCFAHTVLAVGDQALRAMAYFLENDDGRGDEAWQRLAVKANELGVQDGLHFLEALVRFHVLDWSSMMDWDTGFEDARATIEEWGMSSLDKLARCEAVLHLVMDDQWIAWGGEQVCRTSWLHYGNVVRQSVEAMQEHRDFLRRCYPTLA